uniref:Sphingomyelin phosphodiesterase C-terminal domain-containing protein n=1 Tax=Strombidium inclinatum TaxID=197538 RepID=A0A7S3IPN6_9SPIT|mmetsp:Transcript_32466/g.49678  ORF Transcript_32466/g.49678 Transcript_32466/m.49678 type:complete len:212 (+) Transcript_32466:1188-1823(+)
MISHVPNIDECSEQFSRRLHAILDRFQHIIRFGLFGHVHKERYSVIRGVEDGNPIGMNFVMGSVTPYPGKNPNFNVLYVDPETMLPVDLETWTFDLDEANGGEPQWKKFIDYRTEYGFETLSPNEFLNLSQSIRESEEVAKKFHFNSWTGKNSLDTCDEACRLQYYCWTVANDYAGYRTCIGDSEAFKDWALDEVTDMESRLEHHWYKYLG